MSTSKFIQFVSQDSFRLILNVSKAVIQFPLSKRSLFTAIIFFSTDNETQVTSTFMYIAVFVPLAALLIIPFVAGIVIYRKRKR